ncbi:MAG TPA: hypothetical protein VFJ18_05710 [Pararhizobium sp.]|jgi:hypothetical protein|nr:hypothetical protein [Pararhizobium sp.]
MNTLARICWITAPIYALIGMAYGIHMATTSNFALAPAHAHLNLLGWVTIALYGVFYTVVPAAASSMLAKIHVALAEIGVIIIVPGIALAVTGQGEALAAIGSIVTILSMLLFLIVVVRATSRAKAVIGVKQPA